MSDKAQRFFKVKKDNKLTENLIMASLKKNVNIERVKPICYKDGIKEECHKGKNRHVIIGKKAPSLFQAHQLRRSMGKEFS